MNMSIWLAKAHMNEMQWTWSANIFITSPQTSLFLSFRICQTFFWGHPQASLWRSTHSHDWDQKAQQKSPLFYVGTSHSRIRSKTRSNAMTLMLIDHKETMLALSLDIWHFFKPYFKSRRHHIQPLGSRKWIHKANILGEKCYKKHSLYMILNKKVYHLNTTHWFRLWALAQPLKVVKLMVLIYKFNL